MSRFARSALPNALLYQVSSLRRPLKGPARKQVGIYKVDRLGDFVLALGAIRQLVRHYGVEQCALFGSRFSAELAAAEFPGLEVVTLSSGHNQLWKTRSELRRLRGHPLFSAGVESLVCLRHHRTLHDDLLLGAIRAGQTWGVPNSPLTDEDRQFARSRLRFDHTVAPLEADASECLELARHRSVVGAVLGILPAPFEMLPTLTDSNIESGLYAGISPFSSSLIKDITQVQLLAACDELAAQGLEIRIWAEPSQKARYDVLVGSLNQKLSCPVKVVMTANMAGLVSEIRRARLILSADTVTAHLATALDKPLVAFLGGGHYGWFAPWQKSSRQQWLTHRTDCFGCNWRCRHPEPYCLTHIGNEQVRAAVRLALSVAAA